MPRLDPFHDLLGHDLPGEPATRRETVLVTGGAGYIGSHTCKALAQAGYQPVVLDNLSNGHADAVKWGPLEVADLRDATAVERVFADHDPIAVIHFAGLIEVGHSMSDPAAFMANNVAGSANLIATADAVGCKAIVFSSTCATYGEPQSLPLRETHPQNPINPYGRSKLLVEDMLLEMGRHTGLRSAILRYFNAAGADADGELGERHDPETHVLPLAIQAALGQRAGFDIYGTDWDTPDGTCLRDYVHVADLADAHVLAVRHLVHGGASLAVNLGTGSGTSVRSLIDSVERISGRSVNATECPRRAGDPVSLVADTALASERLGWTAQRGLDEIVESAFVWHAARAQLHEAA